MNPLDPAWVLNWKYIMGVSDGAPNWIVACVALACFYGFVIIPCGALMAYFERKLSSDLQARVGPNRAGPKGFLQPAADFFKLLQKRTSKNLDWRESLWLGVHAMALYSTVAVLPLGSLVLLVDTDMSAILPFWAALVLSFGTMLLGLNHGSISGWFGGVRVAAQSLAGGFPALVTILCAGVHAGGFRWSLIVNAQGASPLSWTIFANPFQFVAGVIFLTSGLVLLAIPPLNAGLSLVDLHGGVSSHLGGVRLSLFRFGRFYGFFLWCIISSVLFLGGWALPGIIVEHLKEAQSWRILGGLELGLVLLKTFSLMIFTVIISTVMPKPRVDHVTDLSWKVLSPLSLASLIGAALWAGWVGYI